MPLNSSQGDRRSTSPRRGSSAKGVYLSAGEVVFVFEGHEVEWMVDDLIGDPFQPTLRTALDEWRAIVDGAPRIARQHFGWERDDAEPVPEVGDESGQPIERRGERVRTFSRVLVGVDGSERGADPAEAVRLPAVDRPALKTAPMTNAPAQASSSRP